MLKRLRRWWNKDAEEKAVEETGMTPLERDIAEEGYEGRKDDLGGGSSFRVPQTDWESDSERPPSY